MNASLRRLEHRPRDGSSCATWPSTGITPARAARADRQGRRGGRARPDHRRLHRRRRQPRPPAPSAAARLGGRALGRRRPRRPAPTPVPDARGRAERLQLGRLHRRGRHPVVRGEVRRSRSPTTSSPTPTRAYAKLGDDGGGYDISLPDLGRHPATSSTRGVVQPLDLSLIPNIVNLGAEWADPGYDPGNAHSVPYMWWTTGVGYDTTQDHGRRSTSWKALWDPRWKRPHLDARRLREVVRRWPLIQLGLLANTTSTTELDEALALLEEQKPLVRTYTTDTIATMAGGRRLDRPCLGRGRLPDLARTRRERRLLHPRGGRRPRLGHDGDLLGRASTRSPPTCSSTTCSTPRSAPRTRTTSATWARTRRPRSSSTRRSSPTRRSTRTRRSSTSSRSCSTSPTPSTTST